MEENKNRNQENENEYGYENYESWGTIQNTVNAGSATRPAFSAMGSGYSATIDGAAIEDRKYLLTILGCLVWGFFVNYLICITLGKYLITSQNASFLYLIIPLQIVSVFMNAFAKKAVTKFIAYNLLVVPMGIEIAFVVSLMNAMGAVDAVYMAILGTAVIGALMFALAYFKTDAFLSLGSTLLWVTLAALPAAIIMMIFAPAGYAMMDAFFVLLFAFWLGFDISRAMQQPKSVENAITAAFDVYYELAYNLLRLLLIMARNAGKRN